MSLRSLSLHFPTAYQLANSSHRFHLAHSPCLPHTATRLAKKACFFLVVQSPPAQRTVKAVGMVDALMAVAGWAKLTVAGAAVATERQRQQLRGGHSQGDTVVQKRKQHFTHCSRSQRTGSQCCRRCTR